LAWGKLTGRKELKDDEPASRTLAVLKELAPKYDNALPGQLALAWLLGHPAKIIPLVGSNNPAHIKEAAEAAAIRLERDDWYRLWVAARGVNLP
jgi:predicted oxidoreductase